MSPHKEEIVSTLDVIGERTVTLRRGDDADVLTLRERDGKLAISVVVTEGAVTLNLGGADVELNVERNLSIKAESVTLQGREAVEITTEGSLSTTGRRQKITSTHGDVEVQANDDVKLLGERIRLNC